MIPPPTNENAAAGTAAQIRETTDRAHYAQAGAQVCAPTLTPLVARCCTSHHWLKKPGEHPSHIRAPLTDAKLHAHLNGGPRVGLCPMTPGSTTTRCALIDLDSHRGEVDWDRMREIAIEIMEALEESGLHAMPFRSGGGHGIHLLLLWREEQDAFSTREALRIALGKCGMRSGVRGVAALEAEIFPKADSVPADGWGSMFVLPLGAKSRALAKVEIPSQVPAVDAEDEETPAPVTRFTLEEIPPSGIVWRASEPVTVRERPVIERSTAPISAGLEQVRSALATIPNDGEGLDYDKWFRVVCAVHSATDGSDEGLALVEEFSARSDKHDPEFLAQRVWPYVRAERDNAITVRSLFAEAQRHGWTGWRDAVMGEFDVLPAPTPSVAPAQRRVQLLHISDVLRHMGPIEWVINNLFERNALGAVIGEPGAFKSFFAVDAALSIAANKPWHGEVTQISGPVIYVAGEGHNGFARRLAAWGRHHEIDTGLLPFYKSRAAVPLLDRQAAVDVEREVKEIAGKHGAPVLVVIDTLARNFGDGDENSAKDAGRFIDHIDRYLRVPTGATVLIVHHTGLNAKDRGRGSSSFKAATDFEYLIEKPEPMLCNLIGTKMKDAPLPRERWFKAVPVTLDMDGAESLVLVPEARGTSRLHARREPKGMVERLVHRTVLDLMALDGDALTTTAVIERAIDQLPHDGAAGKRDQRRKNVVRAIRALVDKGVLRAEADHISVVADD